MAMVDADGSCHFQRTRSPSRLAWSEGWRPTGAYSLHSSNEPDELSQWLCHDDSTINIISVIIIIIIIIIISVKGRLLFQLRGWPSLDVFFS